MGPAATSIAIHRLGVFGADPADESVLWVLRNAGGCLASDSVDERGLSSIAHGLAKLNVRSDDLWQAISVHTHV